MDQNVSISKDNISKIESDENKVSYYTYIFIIRCITEASNIFISISIIVTPFLQIPISKSEIHDIKSKRFIKKERNLLEKFSFCWEKNFLVLWILKVLQYYVEKYFIFIKMKGLEVKLLGKRKKILTNMSYLLQRSLFYRFSFKKKGILNVSILHKFNVWHIITKKECQKKGKKYLNEKER